MKIEPIKTSRLILRGFTKEDALWAYHVWNEPKDAYVEKLEEAVKEAK